MIGLLKSAQLEDKCPLTKKKIDRIYLK